MKLLLSLITLSLLAAPVMACEGFKNSISALERAVGLESMNTSAASDTREVSFQGKTLSFITRTRTDALGPVNLGVYQLKNGNWHLIKSVATPAAAQITYQQSAEAITFYPRDSRNPLLSVSAQDLI